MKLNLTITNEENKVVLEIKDIQREEPDNIMMALAMSILLDGDADESEDLK